MHDSLVMYGAHGADKIAHDVVRLPHREQSHAPLLPWITLLTLQSHFLLLIELLHQLAAVRQLHHDEVPSLGVEEVLQLTNIRMLDLSQDFDLPTEPVSLITIFFAAWLSAKEIAQTANDCARTTMLIQEALIQYLDRVFFTSYFALTLVHAFTDRSLANHGSGNEMVKEVLAWLNTLQHLLTVILRDHRHRLVQHLKLYPRLLDPRSDLLARL